MPGHPQNASCLNVLSLTHTNTVSCRDIICYVIMEMRCPCTYCLMPRHYFEYCHESASPLNVSSLPSIGHSAIAQRYRGYHCGNASCLYVAFYCNTSRLTPHHYLRSHHENAPDIIVGAFAILSHRLLGLELVCTFVITSLSLAVSPLIATAIYFGVVGPIVSHTLVTPPTHRTALTLFSFTT